MQKIQIDEKNAGQRMDKFLHKYMPLAPSSFFYKMLRKKNITLNGKKAEGKEKLQPNDTLELFLAKETILSFQQAIDTGEYEEAYRRLKEIRVVYEDEHILILNKPSGILSQKAKDKDLSVNEWLIGYLLHEGKTTAAELAGFKPSICNRLDRNTMGLITGAKTLQGSQKLNDLISSRKVKKFYRLMVKGNMEPSRFKGELLEGYLIKDEQNNKVTLCKQKSSEEASYIQTRYYPVKAYGDRTLVEAELITGKSHQIRAHMAGIGYPLLGDYKYGDKAFNDIYKAGYHINSQMLYACRMEFPKLEAPFEMLSERIIEAPVPEEFLKLL